MQALRTTSETANGHITHEREAVDHDVATEQAGSDTAAPAASRPEGFARPAFQAPLRPPVRDVAVGTPQAETASHTSRPATLAKAAAESGEPAEPSAPAELPGASPGISPNSGRVGPHYSEVSAITASLGKRRYSPSAGARVRAIDPRTH